MKQQSLPADIQRVLATGEEIEKAIHRMAAQISEDYREKEVSARMRAVADPDPDSPGIVTAKKLGLITVSDYHDLYDPSYNIHLLIILRPEQEILDEILEIVEDFRDTWKEAMERAGK